MKLRYITCSDIREDIPVNKARFITHITKSRTGHTSALPKYVHWHATQNLA